MGEADLGAGRTAARDRHGQAVREQQVVRCGQRGGQVPEPGAWRPCRWPIIPAQNASLMVTHWSTASPRLSSTTWA